MSDGKAKRWLTITPLNIDNFPTTTNFINKPRFKIEFKC